MKYLILWISLFWVGAACALELQIADKAQYDIRLARTLEEKARGLMFVYEMPKNQGMLFDFKGQEDVSMWMKNTYIPLDMVFFDCNFRVVDIFYNAKPLSLDVISSDEKFCYILEINGGEAKAHNILPGDKAKLLDGEP